MKIGRQGLASLLYIQCERFWTNSYFTSIFTILIIAVIYYLQLFLWNNQQEVLHITPEDCLNLGRHNVLRL